jgi:hypothetical protein
MDELLQHLLKRNGNVIDVGEVRIAKSGLGKKRQGDRYLVYLPLSRNYLWRALNVSGRKVRVFLQIPNIIVETEAGYDVSSRQDPSSKV